MAWLTRSPWPEARPAWVPARRRPAWEQVEEGLRRTLPGARGEENERGLWSGGQPTGVRVSPRFLPTVCERPEVVSDVDWTTSASASSSVHTPGPRLAHPRT